MLISLCNEIAPMLHAQRFFADSKIQLRTKIEKETSRGKISNAVIAIKQSYLNRGFLCDPKYKMRKKGFHITKECVFYS